MMEVLYAQYVVQIVLMIIQMIITIGVIFGFFNLNNHGNVWEQSLLMFIMGLGALWFGKFFFVCLFFFCYLGLSRCLRAQSPM